MKKQNREISLLYYELLDAEFEKRFFDTHQDIRKRLLPLIVPEMKGDVLSVGWSQTLRFTPPAANKYVVADVSFTQLRNVPERPNLLRAQCDGRKLPFDIGSFDTVIIPNLLHHLAEDNLPETDLSVKTTIAEAARVMRGKGTMIIIEPLLPGFFEVSFRILFSAFRTYMNGRGLPAPCFYSLHNLHQLFTDARLEVVSVEKPLSEEKVSFSWFFPESQISASQIPQKTHIITLKKRR